MAILTIWALLFYFNFGDAKIHRANLAAFHSAAACRHAGAKYGPIIGLKWRCSPRATWPEDV